VASLSHSLDTLHTVELLWTSNQPVAENFTAKAQHSQETHNSSKRAATGIGLSAEEVYIYIYIIFLFIVRIMMIAWVKYRVFSAKISDFTQPKFELSRTYFSVFRTPRSLPPITVPETEVSRVSRQSACEGVKVVSPKHWPP